MWLVERTKEKNSPSFDANQNFAFVEGRFGFFENLDRFKAAEARQDHGPHVFRRFGNRFGVPAAGSVFFGLLFFRWGRIFGLLLRLFGRGRLFRILLYLLGHGFVLRTSGRNTRVSGQAKLLVMFAKERIQQTTAGRLYDEQWMRCVTGAHEEQGAPPEGACVPGPKRKIKLPLQLYFHFVLFFFPQTNIRDFSRCSYLFLRFENIRLKQTFTQISRESFSYLSFFIQNSKLSQ